MHDLDLTTLRLFVCVCETRNIARAAAQANLVGSAISKRLAQLEHIVSTPLLVRRRHGVEPTAAGETLLEHARDMLASAQRIGVDMAAYATGVRGQVRLLATASVLAGSLADDVANFLQDPACADIRVDIQEQLSSEVVRGVREGRAALGLCWDAADRHGLSSHPYRSDQLAIVAHTSHPLAVFKKLRFTQTLDYDHVSLPVASAVQVMLQRAAATQGRTLNYRVIVSNFDAALRVVRANLAISVVPAQVAQPYAQVYGLRVIPLAEPWAKRRFAICCKDEAALGAPARMLLAHLAAQAA